MGHRVWGAPLHRQNGVYEYAMSPYHLNPWKGMWAPAKLAKRFGRSALFIGPPAVFFYYLSIWADKQWEYYQRKEYKAQNHH